MKRAPVEAGPGHGAWPSEVVNGARQDVEQQIVGGAAAACDAHGQVFALRSLHGEELVQRHALLFGEADGGS